jgi:hypothetical protein
MLLSVLISLIQLLILLMHSYDTTVINLPVIAHTYILFKKMRKQENNQNAINFESCTSDLKTRRTADGDNHGDHWIRCRHQPHILVDQMRKEPLHKFKTSIHKLSFDSPLPPYAAPSPLSSALAETPLI